jgi:hypothetical protein
MVPEVRWRMVPEQRVEKHPVTVVRMVNAMDRVRARMVIRSVPKPLVYKTAVVNCEEIPVTVSAGVEDGPRGHALPTGRANTARCPSCLRAGQGPAPPGNAGPRAAHHGG